MTRLGVLGTGMVGRALATRFVQAGHDVRLGSRRPDGAAAHAWAHEQGSAASAGDFAAAAAFGETVINATRGATALDALALAGREHLAGKVLVDVSNPLADDGGGPATLTVANTDSLAECIQRAHPEAHVVKALNTMNCQIMVNPDLVEGDHVAFLCGDRDEAKRTTVGLLGDLGWPPERIIDLGGLRAARGTEAFMLLWLPMFRALGHSAFNLAIAGRSNP